MSKLKNLLLVFLLGISFISCSPEDLRDNCPCVDGNCDAAFYIDAVQNPGSYQDPQGVWHVKWSGLHYFRIKGQTDQLDSEYVVNGVPLIETGYDSNFFYTPTGITWTFPLYSYLGVFSNNNLTNPKLNDNDLRPMFPEPWNDNTNWPEFKYSYDSFRIHQLRIDEQLEK